MPKARKRLYTITIQTKGYVVYEVKAESEEEARAIVSDSGGKCIEENTGDWDNEEEWEIDEGD